MQQSQEKALIVQKQKAEKELQDKAKELAEMKKRVDLKLGRYNPELAKQQTPKITANNQVAVAASPATNVTLSAKKNVNVTQPQAAVHLPTQVKAELQLLT